MRQRIRAMSAATDNVGLFFGEDVFVAFGAIVLMQTILRAEGWKSIRCAWRCGAFRPRSRPSSSTPGTCAGSTPASCARRRRRRSK
jgi:hypothetical protein